MVLSPIIIWFFILGLILRAIWQRKTVDYSLKFPAVFNRAAGPEALSLF